MIRRKRSFTGRVLVAALVLVFGAVSASAYTIVMRDGRRVEIPDEFKVTNSTVTYEAGSDIQVTIQLNTVDIAATERANGEAPGSFLLRATARKRVVEPAPQTGPANAQRSITNADLEEFRRVRVESEKRRQELGLPSLEEQRLEAAAIQDRTLEQVRNMRMQQEIEEAHRQADLLRAQVEANDAEIDFLRRRLDSFGAFPGGFPIDGFDLGGAPFGRFRRLPVSLFPGFLSTPITPFPSISPRFRRPLFTTPGVRFNPHPMQRPHGRHR